MLAILSHKTETRENQKLLLPKTILRFRRAVQNLCIVLSMHNYEFYGRYSATIDNNS